MTEVSDHEEFKKIHEEIGINYQKFHEKGIKTAGTRLRNLLMESKKLCDTMRKDVLTKSKDMPVKKRSTKAAAVEVVEQPVAPPPSPKDFKEEQPPQKVKRAPRKPPKSKGVQTVLEKAKTVKKPVDNHIAVIS